MNWGNWLSWGHPRRAERQPSSEASWDIAQESAESCPWTENEEYFCSRR